MAVADSSRSRRAERATSAAIRSKKADPDAMADLPVLNAFARRVDSPDDFVPRDTRKGEAGELPSKRQAIRVTNAACLHAQSDCPGPGS